MDGKIDVRRQAKLLKKYNPDIIFLQEIDIYTKRSYARNQIYTFSKHTELPYRSIGISIKYRDGFYGDGLLSRFPIEYSANFLSPLFHKQSEQRSVLLNKLSFGTIKLNLCSIHLSTFLDERIKACQEIIRISSYINKGERIIIGGDFNVGKEQQGNHLYTYTKKENYKEYDILKEHFYKADNTEPTWFAKNQEGCIDTFFYSKNLKLSKIETIKTTFSDHNPVYAEFII